MTLRLLPLLDIAEADAVVEHLHRHLDPLDRPQKLALGVADEHGGVRGVAIVGTPAARPLDDGFTFEIRRCATDGTKNACSALYGACVRTLAAAGARRALTYTLKSESGASLRAAGFYLATPDLTPVADRTDLTPPQQVALATVRGRKWGCASRPRPREANLFGELPRLAAVEDEDKLRWAVRLDGKRRRRR